MKGAVVPGRGVMTGLLTEPVIKCLFGLGHREGVGVHDDGGIFLCSHFIDEQVIVTTGDVIDGGKPFILEEYVLFVGEVTPHTHIGDAGQSIGEILDGSVESVEADDLIEESGGFFIRAIAQDHLDAIVVAVLHFLHPEFTGGHTVGVGEEHYFVSGFFDTHAEGVFFAGDADSFLFEIDDMEAFEGFFEFVQKESGLVLAIVVDDDDLMGAGIDLGQGSRQMGNELAGLVTCADDDADWMLLRAGLFGWGKKGETSKEPTIIKELGQCDQTEQYKKYLAQRDAKSIHKHSTIGAWNRQGQFDKTESSRRRTSDINFQSIRESTHNRQFIIVKLLFGWRKRVR